MNQPVRSYLGKKRVMYKSPHMRTFIPTASVRLPAAYLAPPSLAERLHGHGVAFTELKSDTVYNVEAYTVVAREKTFSPDVAVSVPPKGEAEVPLSQRPPPTRFETVLTVRAEMATITAKAGMLLVPTAQRAGVLAASVRCPTVNKTCGSCSTGVLQRAQAPARSSSAVATRVCVCQLLGLLCRSSSPA